MKKIIIYILFYMAFFALLCSPSVAFAQQDDGEIRQLVQRLQQGVTKIERVNILQKLTEQLSNISPAEAIEYANEGLKIAKSQDNTQAQVHFYLHLGIAHFYGETISKANQNLQKALQMRDASLTQRIQAQQYLALCARHEDEQARTKEYLEKAQQEAEKLGDKNLLAQNAFFKAECENSTQALPHYQSALALYEGVRNEAGYAKTAQALGDFYAEQLNNPLTALYYYQKALSVADRIAEKRILSGTLNAMASVYLHQQNDARTALRYYFQTFVIAQEYDFIQNGSKLAQALKGIQVVYQHIARQRRNAGEIDKARQYDKLAERYQRLGQNLVAADYDVALFGSANPEARTYTSPAPNPDRPRRNVPAETLRKSLRSPLDSQSLLTETRRRADSLLIAHKNSQIDHWQEQTSRQEMQLNNLHDEKLQQEAELRRYKLWWFWGLVGLIAILGGLLSYAIYHIRLQKQLISKQKNRVLEAQEKANRYVIVAREHQDVATQKGAEVAQILAELDEKKLENVSFRKTLQEDVLRPITYAIGQEKAHYALQTLLQESIPTAQNSEQTILPILTSAHTQVARLFQQHNIRFEPHIAENLTCLCDAKLLEAVFVHLFYNSLKYVAKGGTIKIDATNEGKRILLTYKDNGQGIPASLHTQAFRKYPSQEARPLANGLYWVKQLMEAQKASIALQPNAMGITVQMSFEA